MATHSNSPTFSETLVSWYHTVKRDLPWRRTCDPYAIWVSEVMLQQTQVKTVIPYYLHFLARFPSPVDLARADLDEVLSVWRGLGYYSRARHLWEGAAYVIKNLHGELPRTYEELRQIPGIGEYTAGAIASIAFGQSVPALDGNVRRILSRILAWPHPVENAVSHKAFRSQLLEWLPTGNSLPNINSASAVSGNALTLYPGDFNQALMELGATVCLPTNPHCPDCPVSAWCQALVTGDMTYPLKRPKSKPTSVTRLTFVLIRDGRVYLQKRPAAGLLADLWEFPGVELQSEAASQKPEAQPPTHPLGNPSLPPEAYLSLYKKAVTDRSYDRQALAFFHSIPPLYGPAGHTFSHRHWDLYWFILPIENHTSAGIIRESQKVIEYRWLDINELNTAPIATAFRKVIESCHENA